VPAAVAAVPVLGDAMQQLEAQARWLQNLLEENARLLGQLPATLRSLNDALERFNDTIGRLDRVVGRLEAASVSLTGPVERLSAVLDPRALRELPELVRSLRDWSLPRPADRKD
jgi:ABC-type transporter Mla subunit MlaD